MAVKVIKRGARVVPKYEFTCDGCNSVLSATTKDGEFVGDWRDGGFYVIKCPVCKEKNNISADLFR